MINYQCPKCKEEMSSPDSLAGTQETCLSCGNVTIVPESKPIPVNGNMVQIAVNYQRIILIALASIGMLGTFLPWASMPIIGSMYGTQGDGWITFGLFAISLGVACLGGFQKTLSFKLRIISTIPSLLASIFAIYKMIDFCNIKSEPEADPFSKAITEALTSSSSLGIGLYLIAFVGIAILATNIYGEVKQRKMLCSQTV